MDLSKYSYNGKFTGNIPVLGQTGCGKTTPVQNLGKNKMFGKINDVSSITKIVLSKDREHSIRSCFDLTEESFYPQNIS